MTAATVEPKVVADKRGCLFFVVSHGQRVPAAFTNLLTQDRGDCKASREVIRFAGGCKRLKLDSQTMVANFLEAFNTSSGGFRGTAFSGGTANVDAQGSLKSDMITNIPATLAGRYPCIAMSTTPRTADLALDRNHGSVIIDMYGGRLDYRQHAALIYQQDPAEVLGWDGDVALYLTLMEGWTRAGFTTAIVSVNGGDVTRKEIYGALKRRIPVILLRGSGRETDAFIYGFEKGDFSATAQEMREKLTSQSRSTQPADEVVNECRRAMSSIDRNLVSIVPYDDPVALNRALRDRGFLNY